ncbi:MAG TPA: hypothetical protein VFD27_00525 [Chthoniobacteraceae bacterium]|nr:hypothetical protein [Chthoniobacteraceae bacterium]
MSEIPKSPVEIKTQRIFRKAFGDRAEFLQFSSNHTFEVSSIVKDACKRVWGSKRAKEIGFHVSDWTEDAAFLVALHLFPERFTAKEIRDGIESLACHIPYHVAGIADALNYPSGSPWDMKDRGPK